MESAVFVISLSIQLKLLHCTCGIIPRPIILECSVWLGLLVSISWWVAGEANSLRSTCRCFGSTALACVNAIHAASHSISNLCMSPILRPGTVGGTSEGPNHL